MPRLKPISARGLTIGYAIALLIIAGLSVTSHVVLEVSLQSNEGSAATINKSGRQRMLSQRIASLATQYRAGDTSARGELLKAIGEFEATHDFLMAQSRAERASGDAIRDLQAVYFAPGKSLDTRVRHFIEAARKFVDSPPGDPAAATLLSEITADARAPLLDGLNQVVNIEQRQSELRIIRLEYIQWAILATVLATLLVEAALIFRPMNRKIIEYTAALLQLATTDPLTRTASRQHFLERCEIELARVRRYNLSVSILMIDVDHFKAINDTYGHAAGDCVLEAVGAALAQSIRQVDICGRLGGEEFAVLLIETALSGAAVVAERVRKQFAGMVVDYGGHSISFTVSIGCTSLGRTARGLDELLDAGDRLMYQAKRTGRNRVVVEAMA